MAENSKDPQQLIPFARASLIADRPHDYPQIDVVGPMPFLATYWRTLVRRRWTIATAILVVTTLVMIWSFKATPIYMATARVQVDPETTQLHGIADSYQQAETDEDFLRTQIQVLQTDQLALRTIQQLSLSSIPQFRVAGLDDAQGRMDASEAKKVQLIRRFKSGLSVELVPGSRVIQVSYSSTDASLGAKIANSLVENYIEYNFRQKYDSTREVSGRLEQQLDELKAKVERSQKALVDYEREHSIANIGDKENVVEQRLGQLSTDMTAAQADRIQKEALFKQSQNEGTAITAQSELLQHLQQKQAELKNEYVEAVNQYGPKFPKVLRIEQQLNDADAAVQKEREHILARTQSDYQAAIKKEQLLDDAVANQKQELAKLNDLLIQQNILAGEFETNQKLYESLLQRLKDATVTAGLRSTNIHLVDPALAPLDPVRPRKALNVAIAMFLGFVFGVMLSFGQEALDNSFRGPEEIEKMLSVPTLAIVPTVASLKGSSLRLPRTKRASWDGMAPSLAVISQPKSPIAEAYRALRTSIMLSLRGKEQNVILITSANAGEGKTCTAVNLAIALAQRGDSVLLLDCDLRKPGVGRVLDLPSRKGVSTVLTGRCTFEEALQQYETVPALDIITSGTVAHSPAELLSSPAMEQLLLDVYTRYKYIIIDSPPVLAVTDATILSTCSDAILLVVEGGVTPKRAVSRAQKILESTGSRILGVVLNKVNAHDGEYYGSYGRYYSYGKPVPEDAGDSASIMVKQIGNGGLS